MSLRTSLNWEQVNSDWPHHQHSEFVVASGLRWHVQQLGDGPVALLVHGTGASTHSWAGLASALSEHWRVVMMDLPGHGFTTPATANGSTLPAMAASIGALVNKLGVRPDLVVGHSAGAAILAQMCLDSQLRPNALVSFNGAFKPFAGALGGLFSHMAKALSSTQLVPWLFSRQAREGRAVQRLIDQTGSQVPPQSAACYQTLLCSQSHVASALRMMANWNLQPLYEQLARIKVPFHLVACANDTTVPISQARNLHRRLPHTQLHELAGLGHLGHEERPDLHHALLEQIISTEASDLMANIKAGQA